MFCGIVSRAATLKVLSTGVAGNYDGALQVVLNYLHIVNLRINMRINFNMYFI
jgi:hypothetical protein